MPQWLLILLIVLAVTAVVLFVLYYFGNKMQKKANDSQEMIEQSKVVTSALIIDKKKLIAQDSSLPQMVQEQIPFYLRWRKLPMVKAKIGPKIATLLCDESVYQQLPIKKMVKIELAGLYIVSIKSGKLETPAKPGWRQRLALWVKNAQAKTNAQSSAKK